MKCLLTASLATSFHANATINARARLMLDKEVEVTSDKNPDTFPLADSLTIVFII